MDIKSRYEAIRKKHSLPAFEELDAEFCIGKIEADDLLIRDVREKIAEKIEIFVRLFEEMMHPDTNISGIYESRVLDEDTKSRVFAVYRELMYMYRESYRLALLSDEGEDAGYIKEVFSSWKKMKPELSLLIEKIRDSWKEDIHEKESLEYFG